MRNNGGSSRLARSPNSPLRTWRPLSGQLKERPPRLAHSKTGRSSGRGCGALSENTHLLETKIYIAAAASMSATTSHRISVCVACACAACSLCCSAGWLLT